MSSRAGISSTPGLASNSPEERTRSTPSMPSSGDLSSPAKNMRIAFPRPGANISPASDPEIMKLSGEEKDRALIVRALATRHSELSTTARYAVFTTPEGSPEPLVSGEGVADFKANQYLVSLESTTPDGKRIDAEVMIWDKFSYGGSPGSDFKTWQKSPFDPEEYPLMVPDIELLGEEVPWPRPTNDTQIRMEVFEALVSDVKTVAEENLRAIPVKHFQVELNRDEAKKNLSPELVALAGEGVEKLDVWLDYQGVLRKMSVAGGSYELWDFNAVPDAQLPRTKLS